MTDKKLILNYIEEKKMVTISNLCKEFSISESTARRIVAHLEQRGHIGRYHGGAYSLSNLKKTDIETRLDINSEKKLKIAQAAANIITEGSTSIILGGSTVSYMCRFIKDKHITVITNSTIVLDELKNFSNIKLIILGGFYNHEEAEVGGIISNSSLSYLRADYLFMGCSGFDERSGFTNRNLSVELYRSCINICNESCVLVDSTKYNRGGTSIAASPSQIKYLITDLNLNATVVNQFEKKGVNVILT